MLAGNAAAQGKVEELQGRKGCREEAACRTEGARAHAAVGALHVGRRERTAETEAMRADLTMSQRKCGQLAAELAGALQN
eukprot:2519427-Pleurochrysis_carterae.AAC.1